MRCPFCNKEFPNIEESDSAVCKELGVHIFEHHRITKKKCYEIQNALDIQQSLNEICNDMRDVIREFVGRLETFERNEATNSFENEVDRDSEDIKLRERIQRRVFDRE